MSCNHWNRAKSNQTFVEKKNNMIKSITTIKALLHYHRVRLYIVVRILCVCFFLNSKRESKKKETDSNNWEHALIRYFIQFCIKQNFRRKKCIFHVRRIDNSRFSVIEKYWKKKKIFFPSICNRQQEVTLALRISLTKDEKLIFSYKFWIWIKFFFTLLEFWSNLKSELVIFELFCES